MGHDLKTVRDLGNMITMAHPDRTFTFDEKTVEQHIRFSTGVQVGMTKLALAGRDNLSSEVSADQLHAVADPQNRHTQFENFTAD